jgi:hypothetical protein
MPGEEGDLAVSAADPIARLRAAFDCQTQRGPVTDECADPARIWAAVRGEAAPEEVRALLAHALACVTCDLLWRLARELVAEEPRAEVLPLRLPPRSWQLALGALAAAAAVALVVAPRRTPGPPSHALRAANAPEIRSLIESPTLPRDRFVLRWAAPPGEARFSLRVFTKDLRPIHRASSVDRSEDQVPASALSALPAGAELIWTVEARFTDGRRLQSPAFVTRVE